MFPRPVQNLIQNTFDYEMAPLIKQTGFREYDARWLFGPDLNLMGVQALGLGLGALLRELGVEPEIVVGHDYRSYSSSIKLALVSGLMAGGVRVRDIGLALSPMAYFAQFALDVPAVAMVTPWTLTPARFSARSTAWAMAAEASSRLTIEPPRMPRDCT